MSLCLLPSAQPLPEIKLAQNLMVILQRGKNEKDSVRVMAPKLDQLSKVRYHRRVLLSNAKPSHKRRL